MNPDLRMAGDLRVESDGSNPNTQQSNTVPDIRYPPSLKQPHVHSAPNSSHLAMSEQAASPTDGNNMASVVCTCMVCT